MMNLQIKKISFIMVICFTCLLCVYSYAGPLDRTSEPRSNPVVNDMLRIPGVVGMNRFEAMSALQQAGLNPALKIKTAVNSKHKGMECKVISQIPLPGGVAMIGSSVTIYVYMPPGASCEGQPENNQWTNEQPPEEGGQWQNEGQVDEQQTLPGDQSGGYPDNSNPQMTDQQPEQKGIKSIKNQEVKSVKPKPPAKISGENNGPKQVQPNKPKIIWQPTN